jgi:hypothetical protein
MCHFEHSEKSDVNNSMLNNELQDFHPQDMNRCARNDASFRPFSKQYAKRDIV